MQLKNIAEKFNVNHKIRFDRGRVYYSYGNAVITAILVMIFSQRNLVNSIIAGLSTIALIYIIGWLDDILHIIDREQDIYSKKNPVMMDLLEKIKEINEKLEGLKDK